jgi:NAD-dependent dihydropyrimidine dehydrogenase PreA subunit
MTTLYVVPEHALVDPVTIFPEPCTGCNRCVNVCPVDLFLPNPQRGGPPLVVFPGECWFEGSCVDICPEPGAIVLNRPFVSRVNWKPNARCAPRREETGDRREETPTQPSPSARTS